MILMGGITNDKRKFNLRRFKKIMKRKEQKENKKLWNEGIECEEKKVKNGGKKVIEINRLTSFPIKSI